MSVEQSLHESTQSKTSSNTPSLNDSPHEARPSLDRTRIRQLIQAIVSTPGDRLTLCEDYQAVLDVYVSDELAGVDVEAVYPAVWQHLQTCATCQPVYADLCTSLAAEMPSALALSRPHLPLSFLKPSPPDAAWETHVRSRLGGAPFHLVVSISPSHVRRLFTPPSSPAVMRRDELPLTPQRQLLLLDSVALGDQELAVEVYTLKPVGPASYMTIQAQLTGAEALPGPLWARLIWGEATQTEPVSTHGLVTFENIPSTLPPDNQDGPPIFELTFEVRE